MTGGRASDREILGLLGIARRAGRVVVGADAIRSAMEKRPVSAIVVARDAGRNARARLGEILEEVPAVVVGTKDELGGALGRGVAALVAVTDRELGSRIVDLAGGPEAPGRRDNGG